MTQDQWLLLALKIVLVAGILSTGLFSARYHRLTRGGWRRDPIGVTLMAEGLLLLGVLSLTTLSVFFSFSRLDSRAAAWLQIGMLGMLAVTMTWRAVVFQRERNGARQDQDDPMTSGRR